MTATLASIGQRALSSTATLEATYDLARLCIERNIQGDFVECGVFAGVQIAAMAKACSDLGVTERHIHLFDSFTGIPKAGPRDIEYLKAGHKAGLSSCPIEDVAANMKEWGVDISLLVYHKGLFAETLPPFANGLRMMGHSIALLRLDGDLYESTRDCIDNLYPLLSPGGWCIVDDYHLAGARAAVTELLGHPGPMYWRK